MSINFLQILAFYQNRTFVLPVFYLIVNNERINIILKSKDVEKKLQNYL